MNISQWPADAREHLLRFLVHTADITNPVRPNDLAQEWSRRIMQEFYAQVRHHIIPISMLHGSNCSVIDLITAASLDPTALDC